MFLDNVTKIMKILRFFGLATFSVENRKSVTKLSDLLHLAVCFWLGSTFVVLSIMFSNELKSPASVLVDSGNFSTYIASLLISLISMISAFFNRHRIWKSLLILSYIDEEFLKIGFKTSSLFSKVMIMLFGVICVLSLLLTYSAYKIQKSLLKAILYMYSGIYFIIGVLSVTGFTVETIIRLKTLIRVLNSILNKSNLELNEDEAIRILLEICLKMKKLQCSLNAIYGFQTVLNYALLFFYTNFTIFMAFQEFRKTGDVSAFTINSFVFAMFFDIFLSSAIFACSSREQHLREAARVSNAIIRASKDKTKIARLISLHDFLSRNKLKFSTGLFDIDLKLAYGVSTV